ncbi:hypothetical protein GGX14DRAFT_383891 [Mycena pura]|uniref:Uncharacterized protein n=1 Tax=Mycena pura TaxID=153505 RepID=A0AAD6YU67_9AGAR|nr:hypothetical protein GGX14DRAFT_383891 [Mycena pura]
MRRTGLPLPGVAEGADKLLQAVGDEEVELHLCARSMVRLHRRRMAVTTLSYGGSCWIVLMGSFQKSSERGLMMIWQATRRTPRLSSGGRGRQQEMMIFTSRAVRVADVVVAFQDEGSAYQSQFGLLVQRGGHTKTEDPPKMDILSGKGIKNRGPTPSPQRLANQARRLRTWTSTPLWNITSLVNTVSRITVPSGCRKFSAVTVDLPNCRKFWDGHKIQFFKEKCYNFELGWPTGSAERRFSAAWMANTTQERANVHEPCISRDRLRPHLGIGVPGLTFSITHVNYVATIDLADGSEFHVYRTLLCKQSRGYTRVEEKEGEARLQITGDEDSGGKKAWISDLDL